MLINNIIKNYENKEINFLRDTIYATENLMEFSSTKPKTTSLTGINKGSKWYDSISPISKVLCSAYGVNKFSVNVLDNTRFNFFKRGVASGGALYPNNIYYCFERNHVLNIYQFNPVFGIFHFLKKVVIDQTNDISKSFLVITNFYFRNWVKYNYFGYRLMLVDTGYMMSNLSIYLSKEDIKHRVTMSNHLNKKLIKILGLDTEEEAISSVIKLFTNCYIDEEAIEICPWNYNNYLNKKNKLYGKIEHKSLNEENEAEYCLLKNNKLKKLSKFEKYRYSPGGGPLSTINKISSIKINAIINMFCEIYKEFDKLSSDLIVYVYCNKVHGYAQGIYTIDLNKGTLIFYKHISNDFQDILRKKNFNLLEVQTLFFVGIKNNLLRTKFTISYFKNIQIQVGIISHLITVACGENSCLTHPVLGFDSLMAEKIINISNSHSLLNLIVMSESSECSDQSQIFI